MKKRTIYIGLFLIFIIGLISLIGTFAIDSIITEGNSSKADYLFNITLGDRTNRDILIPSYDSKIVDIKISNPNDFNMSYLLYLEGVNSNLSIINISNNEASGVLNSKTNTLIKVFIQNNSSSDITTSIKDIVGFEKEKLSVPSNNTSINKGTYYKVIVKSNDNTYGKVKPNIKLSTSGGTVKYTLVPNTGYQYKSTTCNGAVSNNILTISNITSNTTCEVVFEPKQITVNFDLSGGVVETTYTEPKEHTYTVPYNGTYKLETWGAQGGQYSTTQIGYGSYSTGVVSLKKGDILYLNVGGQGVSSNAESTFTTGGYNGGGNANYSAGTGGGATHIATKTGLLSSLSSSLSSILIVSGGGGGTGVYNANEIGGSGGGIQGNTGGHNSSSFQGGGGGGTQTSGGTLGSGSVAGTVGQFGLGGQGGYEASFEHGAGGGGGGLYGGAGGSARNGGGGGGSGYIGNSQLTDKYMYCYNCSTSDAADTKTYTTTCHSDSLTANCVKEGNGATRITLLSNFSHTKTYNTKYSDLPTPTRSGYTFDGWYTGENGTGTKVTNDTVLKNANTHTLYAKWVIKNVKVNFDLAGGVVETTYTEPKEHTYTVLYNGTYKLETWGAQGGGVSSLPGGYGGYSAGNIELSQNEKLYVYVGENYNGYKSTLSFNGGGSGTYSTGENTVNFNGGGATDIRLVSGDWNSTASLASRIIIAGGGGGYSNWSTGSKGGSAGGLIGYSGNRVGSIVNSTGGTQVSGGYGTENRTDIPIMGAFGIGGYSGLYSSEWIYNSGGGGGYYGGGAGGAISGSVGSASGGSSYISGHTGCVAIISQNDITPKAGCTTGTTDNSCSIHYSGKKFTNTVMIDGQGYSWTNTKGALQRMPNPSGGYYASGNGNSGNGAARITLVDNANYKVTYNTKYSDLPTPTRSGYTFAGWYTEPDGGGTRVTNDTVLTNTSDHTLYAKWTVNSYYLDLNGMLDGSSSGGISGYGTADVYINGKLVCDDCTDYYDKHPYGSSYSISDIKAITGHTYNGIYSGSANGTIGTSNVSVQLNFSTNTYTISYNANGGSGAPSSQTKTYGVNLTLSSTIPTRSGYTFLGWSESSSATSATYASGGTFTSNKATTLYAVWKLQIVYIYNQGATNTSLVGGWSTIGMRSELDYQDKRAPSVVYNDTYLSIVQEAGGYGFSGLVYTTNKINLSPYSTLTAKIAYNNYNADYGIFVLDVPNTSDYYVNNSVAKYHVPRANSGGIVTITIDISSISGSYNVALGAVGWSGSNSFYIYELSLK